jgi:hypothetical protein
MLIVGFTNNSMQDNCAWKPPRYGLRVTPPTLAYFIKFSSMFPHIVKMFPVFLSIKILRKQKFLGLVFLFYSWFCLLVRKNRP